jgi:hypothetical protein
MDEIVVVRFSLKLCYDMCYLFGGVDYVLFGCEEGRDWRGMGAFDLFIYLILRDFFTESRRMYRLQ